MNPFQGLAEFVLGRIKQGIWSQWLKFIFELVFSGSITFLFICGSTLVTSKSPALSIGLGMISSAISMTVLFRRESSKLTKGMLVVLPGEEAAKELETNIQIIQKENK